MSLLDIVEVRRAVKAYFNGDNDKTAQWMSAVNPMLGNTSPEEMVRLGREEKLREFVETMVKQGAS